MIPNLFNVYEIQFQVSVADIERIIQSSYPPFKVSDLQPDFAEMVMSVSGLREMRGGTGSTPGLTAL